MSGKYKAYPEYQESEIDWIDNLPYHWTFSKLRYLFSFGKGLSITKENLEDEGIVCVNYGEIHSKYGFQLDPSVHSLKCVDPKFKQNSESALITKGDVIYADTSEDLEGAGNFTQLVSEQETFAGYHTIIARPFDRDNYRFLAYLLDSLEIRTQIRNSVKGVKVFSITQAILRGINVWLPTPEEQTQIAYFLDHETAKIDTLIEKQKRLIELLKEKLQAVISHAVTKGLNPDAPMRDSGVEWLGEVPEGWGFPKISHIGLVHNGSTPDKNNLSYWTDGSIPWMASSCLNSEIVNEPTSFITEEAFNSSSVDFIPAGSVLVGMVGQGKTRGTAAILGIDSCINQNMAAVILSDIVLPEYLLFLFQTMYNDLRELGRGGNQAALNCEIISSIRIPKPSLDEQRQIVVSLKRKLQVMGDSQKLATRQIQLLQERRTSLISAAVTGKIDVRDWTPSQKD